MAEAALPRTMNGTLLGAAFMVGGMSIIGLIDNYVKLIAQEAGLWQFHLLRSAMACGLMALAALVLGWRLRPRRWGAVAIRSLCGGVSMAVYFGALAVLPIAQVGAGLFTAPIFVLILSVLVFGQRVGRIRVLAAATGFAGVVMVLQPDITALQWATVLPMCAGLTWALTALTTRHLCDGETTLTLLFGFFATLGLIGAVGLGLMAAGLGDGVSFAGRGWVTPTPVFWLWTTVQAVGSIVAVGLLTRAYQVGETSYVAPFEYSFLIFAGFWGYVLYGETLGGWGLFGVALIIGSGAVIAVRSGQDG